MDPTHNDISGVVHGSALQAGKIDAVTVNNYYGDAPEPVRRPWNIPPRNPNFVGRTELLEQVQSAFCADGVVAVHSLRGMGGVGKTQLAIEYAHSSDYEVAWWIPAEQPGLIPTHLARLGTALGIRPVADLPAMAEHVVGVLRARSNWLLVFDNAEDPEALQPYLPGKTGHVLITTRRPRFTSLGSVLDVDVLSRLESVALLQRRIPDVTPDQADELAELMGDLPLALEQAGAYVESTALPVTGYLELFRRRTGDMLDAGPVFGAWSLSLDRVARQSPAAVQLLEMCAFLAPDTIPLDLFTEHPSKLPPGLAAAVSDPLAWAETVGILVDHALLRRKENAVSVHRLLQIALRHRQQTITPHMTVLDLLNSDLPVEIVGVPEAWPRWQQLLSHVLAATDQTDSEATNLGLVNDAATYLRTRGQPDLAQPLFEQTLAIAEATHGPDHPEVAVLLNCLAGTLFDQRKSVEARALYERALGIVETTHGPDHPDVAITLNNLASALWESGQPEQAQPLYERALGIVETTYGPDHSHVATALNNLANTLRALGRPEQTEPLYERALAIDENNHGPDHPGVAVTLNNFASALRAQGQLEKARSRYERALTIAETTYGSDHPRTTLYRENLNSLVRQQVGPAGPAGPTSPTDR